MSNPQSGQNTGAATADEIEHWKRGKTKTQMQNSQMIQAAAASVDVHYGYLAPSDPLFVTRAARRSGASASAADPAVDGQTHRPAAAPAASPKLATGQAAQIEVREKIAARIKAEKKQANQERIRVKEKAGFRPAKLNEDGDKLKGVVEMIRGVFVASHDGAAEVGRHGLRKRRISHLLVLGGHTPHTFVRTVQLTIRTENKPTFDLYTHLPRMAAFIREGKRLGGCLILDNTGMAEAVYAFIGYMLESFFDYEDASKYVSRTIPLIANNPGFEEQLKHYATQPQCRNAVIQLETVYDFFPALRPPAGCTEPEIRVRDGMALKYKGRYTEAKEMAAAIARGEMPLIQAPSGPPPGAPGPDGRFPNGSPLALSNRDDVELWYKGKQVTRQELERLKREDAQLAHSENTDLDKLSAGEEGSPGGSADSEEEEDALSDIDTAWQEYFDERSLAFYYYNEDTGEQTWERPEEYERASQRAQLKEMRRKARAEARRLKLEELERQRKAEEEAKRKGKVAKREKLSLKERMERRKKAGALFGKQKATEEPDESLAIPKMRKKDLKAKWAAAKERWRVEELRKAKRRQQRLDVLKDLKYISGFPASQSRNPVRKVLYGNKGGHVWSCDYDGNVKMTIAVSGTHLSTLTQKFGRPTHDAWALDVITYGPADEQILTASFSGDVKIWEDPRRTGAIVSEGPRKIARIEQHIATPLLFDVAPASHPLAHRCVSIAIHPSGDELLVVTETGELTVYAKPEYFHTKLLTDTLGLMTTPPAAQFQKIAVYRGLHFRYDSAGYPVPVPITQIKFSSSGDQIFTAALDGTFTQWTHFLEPVNVYPAECRSVPFLHIGDNYQDRFRRHKLALCRTLFTPPQPPAATTGQQGPTSDGREGSSEEQEQTSGSQQVPAAETAVDGELQLETLEVEEAKDGETVSGVDNEQALQANAVAVDAMSAAAVEGEQAAFDTGLSPDDVAEVDRQAAELAEAEASKADDAADTAAQKAIDLDDLFLSQLRAPNQAKGAVMSFAVSKDGTWVVLGYQRGFIARFNLSEPETPVWQHSVLASSPADMQAVIKLRRKQVVNQIKAEEKAQKKADAEQVREQQRVEMERKNPAKALKQAQRAAEKAAKREQKEKEKAAKKAREEMRKAARGTASIAARTNASSDNAGGGGKGGRGRGRGRARGKQRGKAKGGKTADEDMAVVAAGLQDNTGELQVLTGLQEPEQSATAQEMEHIYRPQRNSMLAAANESRLQEGGGVIELDDDEAQFALGAPVSCVGITRNMKYVFLSTTNRWLQMLNASNGDLLAAIDVESEITTLDIHPGDDAVTIGMMNGMISLFEVVQIRHGVTDRLLAASGDDGADAAVSKSRSCTIQ